MDDDSNTIDSKSIQHIIESTTAGEDPYERVAAAVFRIPIEEVTAEQRSRAKTISFGVIYNSQYGDSK